MIISEVVGSQSCVLTISHIDEPISQLQTLSRRVATYADVNDRDQQ